jgi:hypothetical protein
MDLPGPYWQVPAHNHSGPSLPAAGTPSVPRRSQLCQPAPGRPAAVLAHNKTLQLKCDFVCLDLPGPLHLPVKNQRCTIMEFPCLHQQLFLDSQSSKAQVILWPPQRQKKAWSGRDPVATLPGDPSPAGRPLAGPQLFRPTTRPCN